MAIELSKETSEKAIASLRRYLSDELDVDAGELKARLMLDFILEEIAPSVYNAAIGDAQKFLRDRLDDLEGACFIPEFGHSARASKKKKS